MKMKQHKKNEMPTSAEGNIVEEDAVNAILERENREKKVAKNIDRFGVVTLIIAVVAVIISINSLIKLKEWNVELKDIQVKMDEQFSKEQRKFSSLETSVKTLDAQQKALSKHWNYLHTEILPILQEKSPVDLLWQLKKACGWLKQAELDLRWSRDLDGAILLLKASEAVLSQSKIPQLQPIDKLIATNISLLEAIQPINDVDILNQIKVVSDQIQKLPMPMDNTKSPSKELEKTESQTGWKRFFDRGVMAIKNMVVIHKTNVENTLFSKQSRQMLNKDIFLALQQMQWALLKRDNTLFHWSANQALVLIKKNNNLIVQKAPETLNCVNNLQKLAEKNLTPKLPDLAPVCHQLNSYVNVLSQENSSNQAVKSALLEKIA
jgi:uncharacterized protein HemX